MSPGITAWLALVSPVLCCHLLKHIAMHHESPLGLPQLSSQGLAVDEVFASVLAWSRLLVGSTTATTLTEAPG